MILETRALLGASRELQAPAAAPPQSTRTRALVGGTVIDGTGRAAIPNATVLIRNGRIVSVGAGAGDVPAGAEVIQVRGKYIVPGFVEGHAHYRSWVGELYLNHGVTSVIDVGNVGEWMLALRDGLAKEKITRIPRIYASGYSLSWRGSRAAGAGGASGISFVRPSEGYQQFLSDPAAARKWVATQLDDDKFEFINIFTAGFTDEALAAVIEETRKRGKRVFAHVNEPPNDVFQFVRAGGEGVMHLSQSAQRPPLARQYGAAQSPGAADAVCADGAG